MIGGYAQSASERNGPSTFIRFLYRETDFHDMYDFLWCQFLLLDRLYMFIAQVAYNVQSITGFLLVDVLHTVYVACMETREDTRTKKGTDSSSCLVLQIFNVSLTNISI